MCSQLASPTLWLVGVGQGVRCVEGGSVDPDRFWAMPEGHLQSGGQLAGMQQSKGKEATSHWSEDPPVSFAGHLLYYICWISNSWGLCIVNDQTNPLHLTHNINIPADFVKHFFLRCPYPSPHLFSCDYFSTAAHWNGTRSVTETASFTAWWQSNYLFVMVFAFH